ncbi:transcription-repair coupling factor [Patescibacteria group bacterium]|nr:transcription-repair coupling factor [Patescibacteria group bacterium]
MRIFPVLDGKDIADKFKEYKKVSASGFGNFMSKSFVVGNLLRENPFKKVLWIVNDRTEQENVSRALQTMCDYPVHSLELNEEHINTPQNLVNQIESLSKFMEQGNQIVVTPYFNLLQQVPNKIDLKEKIITFKCGADESSSDIFEDLISLGYEVSDDKHLEKGTYHKQGEVLNIFPVNMDNPIQLTLGFGHIEGIAEFEQISAKVVQNFKKISIYPVFCEKDISNFLEFLPDDSLIIDDELEILEMYFADFEEFFKRRNKASNILTFTSFAEDDEWNVHGQYLSVLRYQNLLEMVDNIHERYLAGWRMMLFTKHADDLKKLFEEKNLVYDEKLGDFKDDDRHPIKLVSEDKDSVLPHSFQNPRKKIMVFSDRIVATFKTQKKQISTQKVYLDFLTSLKINDFVVHADHGIARFGGIEKKTVDEITREYMRLLYAENDKLYVPIDQADKINKYIGADESPPRLTRLGSTEWNTITKKVKKETQEIAKELLQLYAKREMAKGFAYKSEEKLMGQFAETFPYEETPGQIKAICDVLNDMETDKPMDRLVCGDVGFGKTEVAMRAAFKAFLNGKQTALVSPITILTDQHFRSFCKRMEPFNVRIEMLSRFKTVKEQKEIIKKLERGEVDVVIGTHRLLQGDIKFKNLGLVIIDEEQRFGVKQKEKLKEVRAEVDVLTLTATPIPRTLNISLNKLRDITTITTAPPGRLPVITEVRKYSMELIKEAIYSEVERTGQVYVLHNRVQTIDGFADKLRSLCPNVRFIVSHGKLSSNELEKRIIAFKNGEYDVLVTSTIIENGIDLANANTLIVNNAEKFGLAQLYQLRGRVGRGKRQAFAYFLYHAQRLKLDAKKRLRAIVEASELGSGFQIAMKDLEIRGAGDILGANQHGAINVVGVSHFIRMLNKAVDEQKEGYVVKEGDEEEIRDVAIELPVSAYIPDEYIVSSKDKINAYQRLSGADNFEYLNELNEDMVEEFGKMPAEVLNLFKVLEMKIYAKQANLLNVKAENIHDDERREIVLTVSKKVKPEHIFKLLEYSPKWIISGTKLKIKTKDLGVNWFEELEDCVKRLVPGKKGKK